MYFKINETGCGEHKGLVKVRFDCYLDPTDDGYSEHHVTVPIITDPYPGKVDAEGSPADQKDYDTWLASLPTETRDNPLCCHLRCFEPDITDKQLLEEGAAILAMVGKNRSDLRKNANPPVEYTTSLVKIQASLGRASEIKTTDFSKVAIEAVK